MFISYKSRTFAAQNREYFAEINHSIHRTYAEINGSWHAAFFPLGYSDGYKITVANWRVGDEPMQVVSGPMGKQKVHFEAPPSNAVPAMMEQFIAWINADNKTDEGGRSTNYELVEQ